MGQTGLGFQALLTSRKSEAECKQSVLLADGPHTGEPETLAPAKSMASKPSMVRRAVANEPGSRRSGACSSSPGSRALLDKFLQVLGDVVDRGARQETVVPRSYNRGRIERRRRPSPIRSGDSSGSSCKALRRKRLAASRSRLAVSRKSTGVPCLSMARSGSRPSPRT